MSRPCFWLAPLALLLSLAPATSADDVHDLFDGKSLDGWVVDGPAKGKTGRTMWSVEDGRIVCLGEAFGFLRYDRRQFLSVQEPDRQPGAAGSRVEHDRGRVRRPRITVRLNGRTVLEADQSELADVNNRPAGVPAPKDKPRRGYVALQSQSGRVEFRKVQIRR